MFLILPLLMQERWTQLSNSFVWLSCLPVTASDFDELVQVTGEVGKLPNLAVTRITTLNHWRISTHQQHRQDRFHTRLSVQAIPNSAACLLCYHFLQGSLSPIMVATRRGQWRICGRLFLYPTPG